MYGIADTQSPKSRQDWLATLKGIEALKPVTVIPGHYLGEVPAGTKAVTFTADYLKSFEQQAAKTKDSKGLIDAMQNAWPQLAEPSSLELSAKVIKGEMKWPN
ncbi:Metallo-beta-lactamase protein [Pseudomonas savastanoi pv. fraxini]|nr:Metallo-beta-lactamase family protein [Pseudomonas savastanoi pv. fraxini]RMR66245.1 Metallo-beta-lactamase protein [Pseudomonas savastanoi pv. fraxini]RMR66521.1 Metallo-beta-lactamase protein [Pseudomonas savastanoi pv. fraxini]RMR71552.1 Metallo-beta-lactamase protein [Pseudomonas savastanoi pv. fraxini]